MEVEAIQSKFIILNVPLSAVIEDVNSEYLNLSSEDIDFNFRNSSSIGIVDIKMFSLFTHTEKKYINCTKSNFK